MRLAQVTVADFRNFAAHEDDAPAATVDIAHGSQPLLTTNPPGKGLLTTLELSPAFTVLYGHNGAGKTNLLEAIYLVSTLRSFRGAELSTMLRRGRDRARVEVIAHDESLALDLRLEVRIERHLAATRRNAYVDGKLVRAAADFYGRVQAILFTPEDLGVLRGSPAGRRRFVDRVIFAREREHIRDVQGYEKLLRSRNHVLKAERGLVGERAHLLDTYDLALAEVGARIWRRRETLLAQLREPFRAAFAQVHGGDLAVDLAYQTRLGSGGDASGGIEDPRARLLTALQAHRREDEQRHTTTIGPHRDDLQVTFDGETAGPFASQGQARALVLAFKIAELRSARELRGVAPLLLLDDVSSELDPRRNAQLFQTLAECAGQCVLTTTSREFIRLPEGVERRTVELRDGRLEPP